MEKELQSFLDSVIDSLVKLEIVLFFHGNPGTVDTAQGIAIRVCRSAATTATALTDLSSKGVLNRVVLGGGLYELYSLSEDRRVRKMLADLDHRYNGDRASMLEIIRRFIPGNTTREQSGSAGGTR